MTEYKELAARLDAKADRWSAQCDEWEKRITESHPEVDFSAEIALMRQSIDREAASALKAQQARIEALEAERDEGRQLAERQRKHIEDMGRRIHNQRVQLHDTWQTVESRAGWLKGWPIQSRALAMAIAAGKERRASEARCKRMEEALRPIAEAADSVEDDVPDRAEMWENPAAMQITAGNLRAARLALQENTNGG